MDVYGGASSSSDSEPEVGRGASGSLTVDATSWALGKLKSTIGPAIVQYSSACRHDVYQYLTTRASLSHPPPVYCGGISTVGGRPSV